MIGGNLSSGLDHPRSRGVYRHAPPPSATCGGSSPLARGLRRQPRTGARSPRIIPARAGFTPTGSWRPCAPPDHPRSRGVYTIGGRSNSVASGSSPLARGLLQGRRPPHRRSRIIPARAGFTDPRGAGLRRPRDHPRSRGVYRVRVHPPGRPQGSSPLARGLPGAGQVSLSRARIIPARAGFTRAHRGASGDGQDHPRSRGVYHRKGPSQVPIVGSSPLARGLHGLDGRVGVGGGIIPARAGFTTEDRVEIPQRGDHPRSRGVYRVLELRPAAAGGSSPLARGLPSPRSCVPCGRRIIPARAGFTLRRRSAGPGPRDHPRSRGVYKYAAR